MTKEKCKSIKQRHREKLRAKKARQKWLGFGALATIVIALAFWSFTHPKAIPLDEARLAANPTLGPDTAKVTITEYGDFGCSSCQAWHNAGILEQIREIYGDQFQFVWKDFPVITAQSPQAAEAAQCAFDQGKFWEFHDYLYESASSLGVNDLKEYAAKLGLDSETFEQCLDSRQNRAKVELNLTEARGYGFPGTPSFLVNGQKLVGPPSFEALQVAIDAILADG